VRCDEDLHTGWIMFEHSLRALEEHGQIWVRRMPELLGSIMIIDKLTSVAFYLADRCCCVNPWNVRRKVEEPKAAAILLAGCVVYALSNALLLSGRRGHIGIRRRGALSFRAMIRFLQRSQASSDSIDIQAMINVLRRLQGES
jgi:hypothetical protein